MKQILLGLVVFLIAGELFSQNLLTITDDNIIVEINKVFEKGIEAGEKLDVNGISGNVNDMHQAGFIDNGYYFDSFAKLMVGFEKGIAGLESQQMEIENKKITVLSEHSVLLTASGNYTVKTIDGRTLTGKFAWTFVYSKIDGNWRVIHSHMSNPNP